MGLPIESVTLEPAQVAELNRALADARHDIHNHLTLISAAVELIRRDPAAAARLAQTMADRPEQIRDEILHFSAVFERALNISRP